MIKNKFFYFDKIEQKFVFTLSRGFFWIFIIISSITIITGIFVFLYSIIPPGKKHIIKADYPEKPTLSYEEIIAEIKPPEITKQEPTESQSYTEYTETESGHISEEHVVTKNPLEIKYENLIDSLGSLIKTDWAATYESYIAGYDWFGRPIYTTQQRRGIKSDLIRLLESNYPELEDKVKLLENLISIIEKIEQQQRVKAIKYAIKSLNNKWKTYHQTINQIENEYNRELMEAEAEYNNKVAEKKALSMYSLTSVGGAIVIIALVGLILNSLAIERNTRAIKELIQSQREETKNEN